MFGPNCLTQNNIIMVKVTDYKRRESQEGNPFFVLILQGETEIVKSKNGNFYATAKRCSISSTLDEQGCKALIGTEFPGCIKKQDCEPYEIINPDTAEVKVRNFRYAYLPVEDEMPKVVIPVISENSVGSVSLNGMLETV